MLNRKSSRLPNETKMLCDTFSAKPCGVRSMTDPFNLMIFVLPPAACLNRFFSDVCNQDCSSIFVCRRYIGLLFIPATACTWKEVRDPFSLESKHPAYSEVISDIIVVVTNSTRNHLSPVASFSIKLESNEIYEADIA